MYYYISYSYNYYDEKKQMQNRNTCDVINEHPFKWALSVLKENNWVGFYIVSWQEITEEEQRMSEELFNYFDKVKKV